MTSLNISYRWYTRTGVPYPYEEKTTKNDEDVILSVTHPYNPITDTLLADQAAYDTAMAVYEAATEAQIATGRSDLAALLAAREADAVSLRSELQGLGITPSLLYLIS